MPPNAELDSIDRRILDLLVENGRRSVRDIATRVRLSPSPVKRRIERLERLGVIAGYTTLVDEGLLGDTIEAFAEVRFSGNTDVESIAASASRIPGVTEVFTVAGDPDALVHFRVDSLQHLHRLLDQIRRDENVIGTKTLMVLDSWRRVERPS
ncbi:Lrp/AsnC family transcriptional regulator [Streptosporangium amethystogenes]|uniref:Lrp/AsnC family transcriptional regulator n=1 Tax=Streptosporangium amethystogenes TaxID=2002 RepID=UPI0004C6BA6A|nr:Lrp/AsnC family transcriptional regulator [Streptosporangium amethystogenes]